MTVTSSEQSACAFNRASAISVGVCNVALHGLDQAVPAKYEPVRRSDDDIALQELVATVVATLLLVPSPRMS
jgi:hypothetical protein